MNLILALLLSQSLVVKPMGPQGLTPGKRGQLSLFAPLTTAGCYASPTTQGNLAITVTRATGANSSDNSQSCAANQLVVESDGVSSWHGATNYVLNSSTHPKTAQATASITNSAIPFAVWAEGSGTFSVAAGTATLSANSCSSPVSVGTVCSITVSGTGAPTVTTSAGVTHLQIEPQICASCLYKSPKITTAGAQASRNAGLYTITTPVWDQDLWVTNKWCVAITAKPYRAWYTSGLLAHPWMFGTSGAANSAYLLTTSGSMVFNVVDGAGVGLTQTWTIAGLDDNSPHRIVTCNNNGALSMCLDGTKIGGYTGTGTGKWTADPAAGSALGSSNATIRHWDGDLSNFKLCKGATRCSDCP